jgi:hypothetical protein
LVVEHNAISSSSASNNVKRRKVSSDEPKARERSEQVECDGQGMYNIYTYYNFE